jgi:hypothetical protein
MVIIYILHFDIVSGGYLAKVVRQLTEECCYDYLLTRK